MSLRVFDATLHLVAVAKSLIFLCITTGAFASLWGWGWLVCRWTRLPGLSAPLTATIGLGVTIFAGGWLNVVHAARGPVLDAWLLIGVFLAVVGWRRNNPPVSRPTLGAVLAFVPVLLVGWYCAAYITPALGFNFHDDLERYFAYPVRMLATGTLAPNPLGYLGADTLGAGAFLQAFVLAHAPIEYIGSVDLAGGLLLCVALAGFGFRSGNWMATAAVLIAECLLVVVNPQLVNTSSVFCGVALIMAAVLLAGERTAAERELPVARLTGLLGAGLIALKTTFVVFVALYLVVAVAVGFTPFRQRWRSAWTTGVWTLIGLIPWVTLHAPLYWAALRTNHPLVAVGEMHEPLDLFSNAPLLYGSTQFCFTGLALLGFLLAVWCAFVATRNPDQPTEPASAAIGAALVGGLAYFIFVVGLGPWMYGREAATRYAIPVMLGTIPVAVRMAASLGTKSRWLAAIPAGGGLILVFLFAPSFAQNIKETAATHVPWAFFQHYATKERADFLTYNEDALHGDASAHLAKVQRLVPPGEKLAAWVMTPFHLDFCRNPIWHTDPYGVSMPWSRWPIGAKYFLLEYAGPAVRSGEVYEAMKTTAGAADRVVGFRVEAFMRKLVESASAQNIVYQDETYVLIRLPE